MTVAEQIEYGAAKENELLKNIQNKFGIDLKKTIGRYNRFDFINADTLIELKSRRCNLKTYNDTMVGYNKIEYAKGHPDKQVIFCFNFNEGLYYHIYNRDAEYSIRDYNKKPYCFIPTDLLLKV
jgi:hypothetical protein